MSRSAATLEPVARVNGVTLHAPGENIETRALRQRACTELLRQAAQREGLLDASDAPGTDGAISQAATTAIDTLLERDLRIPEPSEEACRRHYAAHAGKFATGERAHVRHILFAVTPGVDVVALRKRAEATLLDVRCHDGKEEGDAFADAARTLSNCPTGAEGGDLGVLTAADCAPEFAREIFGKREIGVLPRLVHSRFGLHVVEVRSREPGVMPSFEAVRGAVANSLRQQSFIAASRQYIQLLAGAAAIEGVDLESSPTPLVQ